MKLEELTGAAIDYIYNSIDTDRLSEWERNFIESTSNQWERRRRLSDEQKEVPGKIWDKQS